ncbi:MAG: BlaI/MecI/CopY family transcriptional regulator [Planctomycetes bacterium]|nr:BlaI/MecI/CopY family transcriptional regulator [Planctomycetota bacterium]
MTPRQLEDPTPAEWRILSLIWEKGALSAREVIDAVEAETGWSTSTVKTLLRRLVDKGHLKTRKIGNSFLYSGVGSPMRFLRRAGDALLKRTNHVTVGPLLTHLVKSGDLSRDDLDELRSLVERLAEDAE